MDYGTRLIVAFLANRMVTAKSVEEITTAISHVLELAGEKSTTERYSKKIYLLLKRISVTKTPAEAYAVLVKLAVLDNFKLPKYEILAESAKKAVLKQEQEEHNELL
ncbi:MAG: hypothetical protein FWG64_01840 [Firmicutes bacterium]|nr:hypothetical protein [Bacillota bacterium]